MNINEINCTVCLYGNDYKVVTCDMQLHGFNRNTLTIKYFCEYGTQEIVLKDAEWIKKGNHIAVKSEFETVHITIHIDKEKEIKKIQSELSKLNDRLKELVEEK